MPWGWVLSAAIAGMIAFASWVRPWMLEREEQARARWREAAREEMRKSVIETVPPYVKTIPDLTCECGSTTFTRPVMFVSVKDGPDGPQERVVGGIYSCQRCPRIISIDSRGRFERYPRSLPPVLQLPDSAMQAELQASQHDRAAARRSAPAEPVPKAPPIA